MTAIDLQNDLAKLQVRKDTITTVYLRTDGSDGHFEHRGSQFPAKRNVDYFGGGLDERTLRIEQLEKSLKENEIGIGKQTRELDASNGRYQQLTADMEAALCRLNSELQPIC